MSRLYEAMFIVDSAKAKEDYAKIEAECTGCLTRHGAEIVKALKWDDRRLTYEIKKVRRGTYILVHFKADPLNIVKMERQCALNDTVLRVLILVDEDGVEAQLPGAKEKNEAEMPVEMGD